MAFNDFEVIVYKVLKYLYACLKKEIDASPAKAQEVAGVGDKYWLVVLEDMCQAGLVSGTIDRDMNGDYIDVRELRITMQGAQYLKDNSQMHEVRAFLGKAFEKVIEAALRATMAYGGIA